MSLLAIARLSNRLANDMIEILEVESASSSTSNLNKGAVMSRPIKLSIPI